MLLSKHKTPPPSRRIRAVRLLPDLPPFTVQHTYQCGERAYSGPYPTLAAAAEAAIRSRFGPLGRSQMLSILDAQGCEVATMDIDGTLVLRGN
jgi:hypothetical protein